MAVLTSEALVTVAVLKLPGGSRQSACDRAYMRKYGSLSFVGRQTQFPQSRYSRSGSTRVTCGLKANTVGIKPRCEIGQMALNRSGDKKRQNRRPNYNHNRRDVKCDLLEFVRLADGGVVKPM